jgi:hypothetical protein
VHYTQIHFNDLQINTLIVSISLSPVMAFTDSRRSPLTTSFGPVLYLFEGHHGMELSDSEPIEPDGGSRTCHRGLEPWRQMIPVRAPLEAICLYCSGFYV